MSDRTALQNDDEASLELMMDGRQVNLWTAIPGIVVSVNLEEMTCEVQPAIKGIIEGPDGSLTEIPLPVLPDVPLVFPQAGGFMMSFPIAPGDEVLVVFSSRCFDAWWQSGGVQSSMEARMHDLSDGFAIPGPFSQPNVPGLPSSTNLRIGKKDSSAYIEMTPAGRINLNSGGAGVVIDGKTFASHEHSAGTYTNSGGSMTGDSGGVV